MSAGGTQRARRIAGRVLLVLLALSAAGGILWFRRVAREPAPEPPRAELPGDRSAEMVTRDFRHVETRMDRTIWVLEAKIAEIYNEEAKLSQVKVTWYGEPGDLPVVVSSRGGRFNFRTRDAVLAGRVVVSRSDGARLSTRRLVWNEAQRTLKAPFPVRVKTATFSFRGRSLVADLERQSVRLKGPLKGDIKSGGGAPFGSPPRDKEAT